MTADTTGTGHAVPHHGELLQGVFRDGRGRTCPGLVTLPMPPELGLGSRAEFTPLPAGGPDGLTVEPPDRAKALRAARLALAACAARGIRSAGAPGAPGAGRLRLTGTVPVGLGMGSSTSDVLATIRAVTASHRVALTPPEIARLAVAAENASDPLMLDDRPALFAQREGRVLEILGDALPPAVVVGCATGGGRPVDTLSLPADAYRATDLPAFQRLRDLLRRAVAGADTALLGRVCTASATRHQRLLAKEELPDLLAIAAETGAAGVQIAHSGNVAGLLFAPELPDLPRRLDRCVRALERLGIPLTHTFTTRQTRDERVSHHVRPCRRRDRRPGPDTPRTRTGLPAL
ncbi:GHMP kinase [Streptomyces hainanensis]|uniref:GHMP kinase n=1 Tax=Streptomyces hainanensis TaxID=402648 RepID=A0A4V2Y2S6_9ACTN|nr:GHMP kinase [Streptomyces hainanensis]TDC73825.1 GHMP kinase [Streptomyces hainanensis]